MKPLISHKYPVGHLANPRTPYVPAAQTDIRATFARAQQQQRAGDPLDPKSWSKHATK